MQFESKRAENKLYWFIAANSDNRPRCYSMGRKNNEIIEYPKSLNLDSYTSDAIDK